MAKLYTSVTNERNLDSIGCVRPSYDKRGRVTQCANRHQTVHVRGWDHGIKVEQFINDDGQVVHQVYLTGGSNGATADRFVFEKTDGETTDIADYDLVTAIRTEE